MRRNVVWLKKDLRLGDHRPLAEACATGPTVALYVYEPSLLDHPLHDPSHLVFANECLAELEEHLAAIGGRIAYRIGEMPQALEALRKEWPFTHLLSHEETGHMDTYTRDKRVKRWCRANGVQWIEHPQFGVFRPHKTRDGWAQRLQDRMEEPLTPAPVRIDCPPAFDWQGRRSPEDLGLPPSQRAKAQPGGTAPAWRILGSFLHDRGVNYRRAMSAPMASWRGCSRISPYITFGAISMREVSHATRERLIQLQEMRSAGVAFDQRWFATIASFSSRLSWHCHFIQKLEDEPAIERENMCRAFDGMRENDFDEAKFEAWKRGETGYPIVDACMKALHATGWINFRMRAMLVSFASYHLWLDWRPTSQYMATLFLDFEPGIHFSQFQMQSGTTGINAIRMYSPIKQALDQDKDGAFIKRWLPQLEPIPAKHLAQPWAMPPLYQIELGVAIGKDYPEPIVDHAAAMKAAKDKVWEYKRRPETKALAKEVMRRHGSRRERGIRRRRGGHDAG